MGECGCMDTRCDLRFPGPDGIMYAIQVYSGCEGCGTPAGVIVYRFDATDPMDTSWYRDTPEPKWNLYVTEGVTGDILVPVLDDDEVRKVAESAPKRGMRDWIEDKLTNRIRDAVHNTIDAWLEKKREIVK